MSPTEFLIVAGQPSATSSQPPPTSPPLDRWIQERILRELQKQTAELQQLRNEQTSATTTGADPPDPSIPTPRPEAPPPAFLVHWKMGYPTTHPRRILWFALLEKSAPDHPPAYSAPPVGVLESGMDIATDAVTLQNLAKRWGYRERLIRRQAEKIGLERVQGRGNLIRYAMPTPDAECLMIAMLPHPHLQNGDFATRRMPSPSSLSDLKKFKNRRQYAVANWLLHTSCCGSCVSRAENNQTNV